MAKEDKEIGKAMERLGEVSEDEHLRYIAELREKAIRDEISGLNGARAEGEAQGMAKGIAKGREQGLAEGEAKGEAKDKAKGKKIEKLEIAKNMLREGLEIKLISKLTNLSIEEINKLK